MKKLLTILTLASATLSHAASPTFGPGGAWGTPTITSGTLALTTVNTGTISGGAFVGDGSALTDMIWSQIGSTPTTLSGYGITDALPLTGGTVTGSVLVDGNFTAGDAAADEFVANDDDPRFPNLTAAAYAAAADQTVALNGAVGDARYPRNSRSFSLSNFAGITTAVSGGSTNNRPFLLQLRVNAGAGTYNYANSVWPNFSSSGRVGLDFSGSLEASMIVSFGTETRAIIVLLPFAGTTNGFGYGIGFYGVGDKVPGWQMRDGTLYAMTYTFIRGSGTMTRASNVVTVNTNGVHSLTTGDYVAVSGPTPTTFQTARTQVTVINTTQFTYASTGSDESTSTSGDSLGIAKLTEEASVVLPASANIFTSTNNVHKLTVRMVAGTSTWSRNDVTVATQTGMVSDYRSNTAYWSISSQSTSSASSHSDTVLSSVSFSNY